VHFPINNLFFIKKKGKAIPVTGCGGLHGCETSRHPHFLDSQFIDGGEVVSAGCPLYPGRFLVLISVRDRVDHNAIVRLEGLGQSKNSMYWVLNQRPSGL
jgi:hypothetical protein